MALARVTRELEALRNDPLPGCAVWVDTENSMTLHADLVGPDNSPFENGVFRILITIPSRYPFEPPQMVFKTRIYHPNIDSSGRICSSVLKLPPKGSWKPTFNIKVVLSAIRILLMEPNPDDPLETDIATEFRTAYQLYHDKAKQMTARHATSS